MVKNQLENLINEAAEKPIGTEVEFTKFEQQQSRYLYVIRTENKVIDQWENAKENG